MLFLVLGGVCFVFVLLWVFVCLFVFLLGVWLGWLVGFIFETHVVQAGLPFTVQLEITLNWSFCYFPSAGIIVHTTTSGCSRLFLIGFSPCSRLSVPALYSCSYLLCVTVAKFKLLECFWEFNMKTVFYIMFTLLCSITSCVLLNTWWAYLV